MSKIYRILEVGTSKNIDETIKMIKTEQFTQGDEYCIEYYGFDIFDNDRTMIEIQLAEKTSASIFLFAGEPEKIIPIASTILPGAYFDRINIRNGVAKTFEQHEKIIDKALLLKKGNAHITIEPFKIKEVVPEPEAKEESKEYKFKTLKEIIEVLNFENVDNFKKDFCMWVDMHVKLKELDKMVEKFGLIVKTDNEIFNWVDDGTSGVELKIKIN